MRVMRKHRSESEGSAVIATVQCKLSNVQKMQCEATVLGKVLKDDAEVQKEVEVPAGQGGINTQQCIAPRAKCETAGHASRSVQRSAPDKRRHKLSSWYCHQLKKAQRRAKGHCNAVQHQT